MKFQRGSAMHPEMDEDIVYSIWKHIAKCTKNRDFGVLDFIPCTYDPCNRRIFQTALGDKIVYSWDHSNIEVPDHPANGLPEFEYQTSQPNTQPF